MQSLSEFVAEYWPHVVLVITTLGSIGAAIHAAMTKQDVRAAIGWVALVLFSPVAGVVFYLVAGVNRVRYSKVGQLRALSDPLMHHRPVVSDVDVAVTSSPRLLPMKVLGDRVSQFALTAGNVVQPLDGGDEAYPAMLEALRSATRCIALGSYIFDNDRVGREFADALIEARSRGVEVRVLIDSIGAKYSRPSITWRLNRGRIRTALFMSNKLGLRLPYANLRSHRKICIVDGHIAFTGGMNIRAGFASAPDGPKPARDVHFRLEGPVVAQLMTVFAHDWEFTTHESLRNETWFPPGAAAFVADGLPVRAVASGPDRNLGISHDMIVGALSMAQERVCIQSPYFLPDQAQISALTIAAQRGVRVDVVIPGTNNLRLVDYAMTAQLDQLVAKGVRVWRATGPFDHSKLMAVDGMWSYVGSSNLDPRSMRLNFELDIEVFGRRLAQWIVEHIEVKIAGARPETLQTLAARPFLVRLRNRLIWLVSPYL
ncbi:cardiolipin synthase [Verticiella sediminum]|uniref:Cardiolipin synthase n=1 Tax=Verticiella sediminum TaxID=1247510 RepID=A0A556ANK4_9BURK|nr:phospholipase D-like domain-containing protein [Verticiella sediminum]TSH94462.1 cardiolipin synthase [Verticiella sediminum]